MFGFTCVSTFAFCPIQGPVAQWPVVHNRGWGGGLILPRCRQARGTRSANTQASTPPRIHSGLCRIQEGLVGTWFPLRYRCVSQLKQADVLLAIAQPSHPTERRRWALSWKWFGTLPDFRGQGEGPPKRRQHSRHCATPTPHTPGD